MPAPVLIVSHGAVYSAMKRIMGFPAIDIENYRPLFHKPPIGEDTKWEIHEKA